MPALAEICLFRVPICCCILRRHLCDQGSAVKHCARRVVSENPADARITMVTSYVPADPMPPDCSILRGPRTNSDLAVLYCQWADYRFHSLASKAAIISQVDLCSCLCFP